jgi:hypothetical protein
MRYIIVFVYSFEIISSTASAKSSAVRPPVVCLLRVFLLIQEVRVNVTLDGGQGNL